MNRLSRRQIITGAAGVCSAAVTSAWATTASAKHFPGDQIPRNPDTYIMIADLIDMQKVVRWALEMSDIYSPSGEEAAVAQYLYEEFRRLGLQCKLQPVARGRDNAIGRLEGTGGGYELMLSGHLDRHPLRRIGRYAFDGEKLPLDSEKLPSAKAIGDRQLFGHRIVDTNAAIAAYLGAVDAIIRSDVRLKGSVVIAGIVGAQATSAWTNGNPVLPGEELGAGAKYMLSNGVTADMCVVAEPTSLAVLPAHLGRVRVRLSVSNSHYGLISSTKKVLTAFEGWALSHKEIGESNNGYGHVYLAGIHGLPDGDLSVYFELRIVPGEHPLDVINEIRGIASRLQAEDGTLSVVVEPLLVEPGTKIEGRAPVVLALQRAHEQVAKTPARILDVGLGGDAVRFNAVGIPTVVYGPGKLPYDSRKFVGFPADDWNYQDVEELATAARVYAVLAADICSRDRSS